MNNKFIVIEGLDGSGKTTAASKIIEHLNSRYGIYNILMTHEPGGTPVSDVLRVVIKHSIMNESIHHISELLMIYAARFQLVEQVIKPALSNGYWVIGDRYDLSSQAYQGGGRQSDMLLLRMLSERIMNTLSPDLTLYLDVTPEVSMTRIKSRGVIQDRIEQESLKFFNRVRDCYQKLVATQRNIITIDANQKLGQVSMTICKHLDEWLLSS